MWISLKKVDFWLLFPRGGEGGGENEDNDDNDFFPRKLKCDFLLVTVNPVKSAFSHRHIKTHFTVTNYWSNFYVIVFF